MIQVPTFYKELGWVLLADFGQQDATQNYITMVMHLKYIQTLWENHMQTI